MGVPYNLFPHLTPVRMKDFYEAYEQQRKIRDEENWMLGIYVHSALSTVLSQMFSKNSKVKYMEEPILKSAKKESDNKEFSEEELIKYSEMFLTKLELMAVNHRLSKNKD